MFHILQGRAGTGKSTVLFERVVEASKKRPVLLLVPEQFTFETERKFYQQCGAGIFARLKVTSFSRFATQLLKQHGIGGGYASDSVKLVLLVQALQEVKDLLGFYQQSADHLSFAEQVMSTVTQFKHAGVDSAALKETVAQIEDQRLQQKLADLHLIYQSYEARVSQSYLDNLDDLVRAADVCKQHPLHGYAIFIDEFKGLTVPELQLLEQMFKGCAEATVALCTDGCDPLFAGVEETKRQLIKVARQAGMRVAVPQTLTTQHRLQTMALCHLEQHVLQQSTKTHCADLTGVSVMVAQNEYDEIEYVAATIQKMVHEGKRFSEIVVATRNLEVYRNVLSTIFARYDIPFHLDRAKPLTETPLYRLVSHLLAFIERPQPERLLALLKCGLTPFSIEVVSSLENYLYYWSLKVKDWQIPFTLSPFGMEGARTEQELQQQELLLAEWNTLRESVIHAVNTAKTAFQQRRVQNMAEGVLEALEHLGVRDCINQMLQQVDLSNAVAMTAANEQKQAFEEIGHLCDLLVETVGQTPLDKSQFTALFGVVAKGVELSDIPRTADCVLVGSADHLRADAPKVTIVLGVNDQVFPYVPSEELLLQDRERQQLTALLPLEFTKSLKERVAEERFIAYKTMTMPSERLLLTLRKADIKGATLAPSSLLLQFKRLFSEAVVSDTAVLSPLDFCYTPQSAFSKMTMLFQEDSVLSASLKEYFSTDVTYKALLDGMQYLMEHRKKQLHNREQTKALFGQNVRLSPSRVEAYHRCKFRFFCEYGLKLKGREKLQLNALHRGNAIHDILHKVCVGITDYSHFSETQVKPLIQTAVGEYLEKMGGSERQTARFLYLYERIQQEVLLLLKKLFEQLANTPFRPTDFEYEIGKPGNTPGYRLTVNDITVTVHGVVDRVDQAIDQEGQTLIRIIDYKTGLKEFRLSDIYHGLNLQMLLYLLCLQRHGKGDDTDMVPAGALYMPAGSMGLKLGRQSDEMAQTAYADQHYLMKGVIVDRESVVRAMEPGLDATYTPIALKKNAYNKGDLREDIFVERQANEEYFSQQSLESMVTDKQLNMLFTHIETLLHDMVAQLYQGDIEAKPLTDTCRYCDFAQHCGFEATDGERPYEKLKRKDLFARLREEQADG